MVEQIFLHSLIILITIQELDCIGALSFFTTRREVLEKFFLINFIGVIFEAGNETSEKNLK